MGVLSQRLSRVILGNWYITRAADLLHAACHRADGGANRFGELLPAFHQGDEGYLLRGCGVVRNSVPNVLKSAKKRANLKGVLGSIPIRLAALAQGRPLDLLRSLMAGPERTQ